MKTIALKHELTAPPKAEDFMEIDAPAPVCPHGGVLIKTRYISLDPYVGARLRGRHMGEPAPAPKTGTIPGGIVGRVLESKADDIKVGEHVFSMDGHWSEIIALPASAVRKVDPDIAPLSAYISALGMPGLTAWASMAKLAKVTHGDTVLVNAAAGPVGGMAGQIARLRGAKTVIGIAGGADKCKVVTDTYGFDACFDYKTDGWQDELKAFAPGGISVHHENVSEDMLAFALANMSLYGRAVLCGLAAHYHSAGPPASVRLGLLIAKRASLHGLVVYDFYDRWDAFISEVGPAIKDGTISIIEDRRQGLSSAANLMQDLVNGKNFGKCLIEIKE